MRVRLMVDFSNMLCILCRSAPAVNFFWQPSVCQRLFYKSGLSNWL